MSVLSPLALWLAQTPIERSKVGVPCYQRARFSEDGQLDCDCARHTDCDGEFFCEMLACAILMPAFMFLPVAHLSDEALAAKFGTELWSIKARRMQLSSVDAD